MNVALVFRIYDIIWPGSFEKEPVALRKTQGYYAGIVQW